MRTHFYYLQIRKDAECSLAKNIAQSGHFIQQKKIHNLDIHQRFVMAFEQNM